jgi:hypothetical protein
VQSKLGPCPKASDVCPYKGCPVKQDLMCSLQGNCFEKQCYCAVDKSGDDCSQTLCDTDQGCLDGQFCSAAHECTWGVAPPPPPPGSGDTLVVRAPCLIFTPWRCWVCWVEAWHKLHASWSRCPCARLAVLKGFRCSMWRHVPTGGECCADGLRNIYQAHAGCAGGLPAGVCVLR